VLEHGGRLRAAARQYGIPLADWLDLSTGISPWSWLTESGFRPATDSWQRLPEEDDGLEQAAADYFGAAALPVAGSQAAIQELPTLRAPCRVGVLQPSYSEHAEAWRRAGHSVSGLAATDIAAQIETLDVLVLCNPNNPDGQCFPPRTLTDWSRRLAACGGWLVVDEAFIDATPADSLARLTGQAGLIVLRSLGKFFGLAGARVGFVLCTPDLRQALRERLGPWTVSGPAREVATLALRDRAWQQQQMERLHAASQQLAADLLGAGLAPASGCALFQWVTLPEAANLQCALAQRGIWVRRFDAPASLRFGLPGDATARARLRAALGNIRGFRGE
jgi:L-threonine-O-3-phosphate decarboxylase